MAGLLLQVIPASFDSQRERTPPVVAVFHLIQQSRSGEADGLPQNRPPPHRLRSACAQVRVPSPRTKERVRPLFAEATYPRLRLAQTGSPTSAAADRSGWRSVAIRSQVGVDAPLQCGLKTLPGGNVHSGGGRAALRSRHAATPAPFRLLEPSKPFFSQPMGRVSGAVGRSRDDPVPRRVTDAPRTQPPRDKMLFATIRAYRSGSMPSQLAFASRRIAVISASSRRWPRTALESSLRTIQPSRSRSTINRWPAGVRPAQAVVRSPIGRCWSCSAMPLSPVGATSSLRDREVTPASGHRQELNASVEKDQRCLGLRPIEVRHQRWHHRGEASLLCSRSRSSLPAGSGLVILGGSQARPL
jgi:hypothetical protein